MGPWTKAGSDGDDGVEQGLALDAGGLGLPAEEEDSVAPLPLRTPRGSPTLPRSMRASPVRMSPNTPRGRRRASICNPHLVRWRVKVSVGSRADAKKDSAPSLVIPIVSVASVANLRAEVMKRAVKP